MHCDLVSDHLLVDVDGLWHEWVELEGGDSYSIEGRVAVDRSHNVQPGLENMRNIELEMENMRNNNVQTGLEKMRNME